MSSSLLSLLSSAAVLCVAPVIQCNQGRGSVWRMTRYVIVEACPRPPARAGSQQQREPFLMPEGDDKDQMQVAESAGESVVSCLQSSRVIDPRKPGKNSVPDAWILRSLSPSSSW